jgi:hypothetical protein
LPKKRFTFKKHNLNRIIASDDELKETTTSSSKNNRNEDFKRNNKSIEEENRKIFADDIFITDITSGFVTVTIKESTSTEGFFKTRQHNSIK